MNFTKLALSLTLTWGCASALAAPPPLPGQPQQAPRPQQQAGDDAALPTPSSSAQKLYSSAKADLLQVRSLLKSGRTQSSVGSGFLVGTSNLVLTNYHVVSQFALDPETYIGEWVDTAGQRGNIELLAVDVLHDLAVVRVNR
jgi:serine protease Do